MSEPGLKDALENIARARVPETINLWPEIEANLHERRSFVRTLRARPLLTILVMLLIILLLTGAAYAIGKSLGYIPGIGLIDQSAPIRVLSEPVSQTRDGITITVEEAVLSSDKTVIVFTVDNIPLDKLSKLTDQPQPGCYRSDDLKLPDGSLLKITGGQFDGYWGSGYKNRSVYSPVPADVNEATLLIPCIQNVLPGALPENWEFPLHFVPAPADMTALPVIESTPSPEPGGVTTERNPITVTKVIDLNDSYILIGEFAPPMPAGLDDSSLLHNEMSLTDGKGQDVNWEYPKDFGQPEPSPDKPFIEEWSIQVAKGFTLPLNIKYSNQYSYPFSSAAPLEFEFDAGENPQPGNEWQLNKEFNVDGHTFTLATIDAETLPCFPASGYGFVFTSPETFTISTVTAAGIEGHAPVSGVGGCTGGGGGGMDAGLGSTWANGLMFAEMPKGKLKVKLSVELYSKPREWTLRWQLEGSSSKSAAPTDASQACLTMDSWKTAMKNPVPIPSDLTGKLVAYGRIVKDGKDPSSENSGLYVMNLDGSHKKGIGQGNAASLSPDGTQAVYENWDGGIFLVDIASGKKHQIPNTDANDFGPHWSPDGKHIAFIHYEGVQRGIIGVSIINPDGTGLQRVIKEFNGLLIEWTSDGTGLFYGEVTKDGILLKKLDIASGATSDLFAVHDLSTTRDYDVTFDISRDGNKMTFFDQVGDSSILDGLYVSKLDGSDRKLISFQSQPWTYTPILSPDGKWLMTYGNDSTDHPGKYVLVNVQDCRIIPLPWLDDAQRVWEWIP